MEKSSLVLTYQINTLQPIPAEAPSPSWRRSTATASPPRVPCSRIRCSTTRCTTPERSRRRSRVPALQGSRGRVVRRGVDALRVPRGRHALGRARRRGARRDHSVGRRARRDSHADEARCAGADARPDPQAQRERAHPRGTRSACPERRQSATPESSRREQSALRRARDAPADAAGEERASATASTSSSPTSTSSTMLDRAPAPVRTQPRGALSLWDEDHGPRDGSPLRPWIDELLGQVGIDLTGGKVYLLTFPAGPRLQVLARVVLVLLLGGRRRRWRCLPRCRTPSETTTTTCSTTTGNPSTGTRGPGRPRPSTCHRSSRSRTPATSSTSPSPARSSPRPSTTTYPGPLLLTAAVSLHATELTDRALLGRVLRLGPDVGSGDHPHPLPGSQTVAEAGTFVSAHYHHRPRRPRYDERVPLFREAPSFRLGSDRLPRAAQTSGSAR